MSEPEPTRIGVEEAAARLEELSLLMSGGESLEEYIEEFRAQGQSQCTNVWSKGIIAYRCRTCQMNDSRYVSLLPIWLSALDYVVLFSIFVGDRFDGFFIQQSGISNPSDDQFYVS
jgi:hypothetical protein